MGSRTKLTTKHLEHMAILIGKGFNNPQVSGMLGVSETTVQHYRIILPAVHAGQPFELDKRKYNRRLVAEYAKEHFLPEPVNLFLVKHGEQISFDDQAVNQDEVQLQATDAIISSPVEYISISRKDLDELADLISQIGSKLHAMAN